MARYVVILMVVFSIFSLNAQAYGAYTLVKDVFNAEGTADIISSANYKLQGTLGQSPNPGIPRSTNHVIYEGFWNAEGMGVPPVFVKDISDKLVYVNEQCGSGVYYIPFEATDDKTAVAELVIEKSSSNEPLIPKDNIEIIDNKRIKITVLNKISTGNVTITLTVKDADGLAASESFNLAVKASSSKLQDVILVLQALAGMNPTNIFMPEDGGRIEMNHAIAYLRCLAEK
ncbi:MAG: hypothetical protein BWK80_47800 [Desulfobacteraceae bacterium IS3]|nr:MAG: hypothetical protein BWK80_47800 [Desulfobacteraceae bacterium IS3]